MLVTAAIIEKDDKVLITQRKADDKRSLKWEFPGGKVKDGETPEACLKREIKEELGIDVSVLGYFGTSIYHYDDISVELMAYQAVWQAGEIILNAHNDFRWVLRKPFIYCFLCRTVGYNNVYLNI